MLLKKLKAGKDNGRREESKTELIITDIALKERNSVKERIGVWGSKYDFYIIPKNNEIYGQYIGVHDSLPKLYYGNDLVLELSKIKSSKHRYQFQNMQDVVDYFNSFINR